MLNKNLPAAVAMVALMAMRSKWMNRSKYEEEKR